MSEDYSYLGSGKTYMREVGSSAPLIEIGNASSLKFAVAEEVKEQKDYTTPGGGTRNEVRRISSVTFSSILTDLSPANLAMVLFGDASNAAAGNEVDEQHTAYQGGLIPLNHPNPSAVTVSDASGGAGVDYAVGDDYEVRPGGIYIVTGGAIADASEVYVDYSYPEYDMVEALTNSSKEYEIFFEGLNEARSGKVVTVHPYRVKIGAAKEVDFIGDEYASLSVEGKVLIDTSKTGGISQYFKAQVVK